MYFLSVAPFLSISSHGRKINPSSDKSNLFLSKSVTFEGNVTFGAFSGKSASLYAIPDSVVFDTTNLNDSFSASFKNSLKSLYGSTVREITSIIFFSTVGTPFFIPRIMCV